MEIKERLKLIGNDCNGETALMIMDEGEEYPLFLETLHDELIFPGIIESGYTLTEYPYNFVKDGKSILELPIREYCPSETELQIMYDTIGTKVPEAEVKKHIIRPVSTILMPDAEYTINTREEFLEYLTSIENINLAVDYLPINYFVRPEARFTYDEYTSPDFSRYISILEGRRRMPVSKFHALVSWLLKHGLSVNYTTMDVVEAYMAWGIDGLNESFISKYRKKQSFTILSNMNNPISTKIETYGFIDCSGNLLTPLDRRNIAWGLPSTSPDYITSLTKNIKEGNVALCKFQAPSSIDVLVMETPSHVIKMSDTMLILDGKYRLIFSITNPSDSATNVPVDIALPCNKDELHEYVTLNAIARMITDKCKNKYDISSKNALSLIGLDPETLLDYFSILYSGLVDNPDGLKAAPGLDVPQLDSATISMYFKGMEVDETVRDVIESILAGDVNVGKIGVAYQFESTESAMPIYHILYAVKHVFGYTLENIYETVRSAFESDTVTFHNDGLSIGLSLQESMTVYNAYTADLLEYELSAAKDCRAFYMLTKVARELGNDNCKRHVGFEGYRVIKSNPVNQLLNLLTQEYETACAYSISDTHLRAETLKRKDVFACFAFFEAAFKGRITFPPILGGNIKQVSNNDVAVYRSYVMPVVESTLAYCDRQLDGDTPGRLAFHSYCVNAYITPEYVIPRVGQTLNEYSFYTLWADWSANPAIYGALIDQGVIDRDFIPWGNRYMTQGYSRQSGNSLTNEDSLYTYYRDGSDFIQSFIPGDPWICVPHPLYKLYPGIKFMDEAESDEMDDSVCADTATVRLGLIRKITTDDYVGKVYPVRKGITEEQYISQFTGYHAAALIADKTLIEREPSGDGIGFFVHKASGTICPADSTEFVDFRRLEEFGTGYNYIHVYGRTYLLRDAYDKLWEVVI